MKLGKVRPSNRVVEGQVGTWWAFECYRCQAFASNKAGTGGASRYSYRTLALAYDALVLVHAPWHALAGARP